MLYMAAHTAAADRFDVCTLEELGSGIIGLGDRSSC